MELMTKLKEMIPWKRKPVERHEVLSLRDDINRLFDRFLFTPFETDWTTSRGWGNGIDIDETDRGVVVRIEVPGLDPSHLEVTARQGMLDVRYERQEEWREGNGGGTGRRYAAFHRTIALPDGLDTARAEAVCKHGLLTVQIPWTQEAKDRARRIVVSVE